MATSITVGQVSAMFKQIYADNFLKASEVETSLQELIPFEQNDKPGEAFVQAIQMTGEWGYTLRQAGQPAGTMNSAIPMKVERATITGSIIDFSSVVDIEVMAQALTSKQSFRNIVGLRMEGMRDSMKRLVEVNSLYGGEELAVVSGAPVVSGSDVTVTISDASWSGGWWAGTENLPVDIYASNDTTKRTAAGAATVKGYDLDAKTITFTCASGTDASAVADTDHIWLFGATTTTVLPGISKIIKNTSSTINNISASTYPLWRGVSKSVGGQLTMAQLLQVDARIAERSPGKKVVKKCLVSPRNWAVLNSDLSGNRRYDGSYSRTKGENGVGLISYYSPNGQIDVETHKYVKDGDAFILNPSKFMRIGPSDVTFEIPGAGGDYFQLVPGKQQIEYRGYSHQGVLCTAPASNGVLTNLTVPT